MVMKQNPRWSPKKNLHMLGFLQFGPKSGANCHFRMIIHSANSYDIPILPLEFPNSPCSMVKSPFHHGQLTSFMVEHHHVSLFFMVVHGFSWFFMVVHGFSWFFMVFHGILWYFMVLHGFSWYFMVFHGISWLNHQFHGWQFPPDIPTRWSQRSGVRLGATHGHRLLAGAEDDDPSRTQVLENLGCEMCQFCTSPN